MNRIQRVVRIMRLLDEDDTVTVKAIANAFECHTRTIFRDLKLLREAGIDVIRRDTNGDARSCVRAPLAPVSTRLALDEIAILLVAASLSPLAASEAAASEIQKITSKILAREFVTSHIREIAEQMIKTPTKFSLNKIHMRRLQLLLNQ